MSRRRKLLVLLGIGAASLLASLPFLRRQPVAADNGQVAASRASEPAITLDADAASAEAVRMTVEPTPVPEQRGIQRPAVAQIEQRGNSLEEPGPPPLLPSEFPERLASAAPPVSSVPREDDDRAFESAPREPPTFPPAPVTDPLSDQQTPASPPPALRRHTIRDGDTLERLAERYLGDARHAGVIYDANRAAIPQRDLLPIGVEIVIPTNVREAPQ